MANVAETLYTKTFGLIADHHSITHRSIDLLDTLRPVLLALTVPSLRRAGHHRRWCSTRNVRPCCGISCWASWPSAPPHGCSPPPTIW
ncbi:MAG: hypothetical protein ACLU38_01925 [Dysosmobacter sp.]